MAELSRQGPDWWTFNRRARLGVALFEVSRQFVGEALTPDLIDKIIQSFEETYQRFLAAEGLEYLGAATPGEYRCRECGITHVGPGWEIDGEPLCWADHDLCSRCQDFLQQQLEKDAARYRFLRNRQTRAADIEAGGVFAGRVPENLVLGGEDLDRAIDAAMGGDMPETPTLEARLAECLAECIDTPLLTGRDEVGGFSSPLEIRIGFFRPELSERAAELLEEAGR